MTSNINNTIKTPNLKSNKSSSSVIGSLNGTRPKTLNKSNSNSANLNNSQNQKNNHQSPQIYLSALDKILADMEKASGKDILINTTNFSCVSESNTQLLFSEIDIYKKG